MTLRTAESPFSGRPGFLLALFLFTAVLISGRLFYFMVVKREKSFTQMEKESLKKGRLRALRGSLLSPEGKVLAWSTRHTALYLKSGTEPGRIPVILSALEREFGFERRELIDSLRRADGQSEILLREDLSPDELNRVGEIFGKNGPLSVRTYFKRHRVRGRQGRRIGSLHIVDGSHRGLNGFEKKYDRQLRGSDLVYEVMVDRQGRVLEKTYHETSPLKRGEDIRLSREEWP